jgi:hypothetical protein
MNVEQAKSRDDGARTRAWISEFASESGVAFDIVERLYGTELARLARDAHIREYVPVLAANNVRRHLRALRDRRAA